MADELVLNREAMRVVERNERGNVTYRKRYKKGDVVDTSHMDDARVEALVEDGALVSKSEYDGGAGAAADYQEGSGDPTGEAAVGAAGVGTGGTDPVDPDAEPDEGPDVYDGMGYPELQQEAKSRDLNAGGSADEIRARLRENDAEQEADDDEE